MSLSKEANKLFKNGKYQEAYFKYKELVEKMGLNVFKYNLDYCEKYLNNTSLKKDIKPVVKKGELDSITKILLNNTKELDLTVEERKLLLSKYSKIKKIKSEDAQAKQVNPIPGDWPKDLKLRLLPLSTNDFDWLKNHKLKYERKYDQSEIGLSIIIPTFNRRKLLEVTLACLVNQKTKFKFEVIVSDDGSKENLTDVTRKFEKTLDIKFVRQKDYGYQLCAVRNLGLRTAM